MQVESGKVRAPLEEESYGSAEASESEHEEEEDKQMQ